MQNRALSRYCRTLHRCFSSNLSFSHFHRWFAYAAGVSDHDSTIRIYLSKSVGALWWYLGSTYFRYLCHCKPRINQLCHFWDLARSSSDKQHHYYLSPNCLQSHLSGCSREITNFIGSQVYWQLGAFLIYHATL